MSLIDLHDFCHDLVQEIAVMRDNENCAPVIQKIVLQPFDGIHVKMVRRLVQQHEVRSGEQQLSERNPRLLSAGQCVDRFAKFIIGKPETAQNTADLTLPGIASHLFEMCLCLVIALHQLIQLNAFGVIHFFFHGPKALFHVNHRAHHFADFVIDAPA